MTINAKDITMKASFGGLLIQSSNLILLSSSTLPPESILYGYPVSIGAQITYDSVVLRDGGGVGTVTLDSLARPTITASQPGMYGITFQWDGRQTQTIYYPLTSEAIVMANEIMLLPQDAEGWTIIPDPLPSSRIAYIDVINGDDALGQTQSLASITGDWKDPTGFTGLVYKTRAAIPDSFFRFGQADYVLLRRGQIHPITPAMHAQSNGFQFFNAGLSASQPHIIASYGTGALPDVRPQPGVFYGVRTNAVGNVGVFDLQCNLTWHDPDHVDFVGWGSAENYADMPRFVNYYPGGGGVTENQYMENLHCNFIGLSYGAGARTDNLVIRRCSIQNTYSERGHQQGLSGDFSHALIEDVVMDHNGWYEQSNSVKYALTQNSGTHTGVTSTAFLEDNTKDWSLAVLAGARITNTTTGSQWLITSNNTTQLFVTLMISGTRDDFQPGDSWSDTPGGGVGGWFRAHGQANIFSHNSYLRDMRNSVIKNNLLFRPCSIQMKLTSFNTDAADELAGPTVVNLVQFNNFAFDGELGFGGFGNEDYDYDVAHRSDTYECVWNVTYKLGVGDSTKRGVAHAGGTSDAKDGLLCGNIIKDIGEGNPDIDNTAAFGFGGHSINTIISRNVAYNIGPNTSQSGGAFKESVSLRNSPGNITGSYVIGNYWQQVDHAGVLIGEQLAVNLPGITYQGNHYYSATPAVEWAYTDGVLGTIATMVAQTGETGHTTELIEFNDTTVSLSNYMRAEGFTGTDAELEDLFIQNALGNQKGNWDDRWTARYLNAYFRYGMTERVLPDVRIETIETLLTGDDVGSTQTFTFNNVGQVKGAIFIRTNSRSGVGIGPDKWLRSPYEGGGTPLPYAHGFCVGFADANGNQWCWENYTDTENGGYHDCQQNQISHACIRRNQGNVVPGTNWGIRGEWALADTNAFGINTVTIKVTEQPDWSDPPTSALEIWNVVVIAFGGDDVEECIVGNHNLGTGTAPQSVNIGHATDLLVAGGIMHNIINNPAGPVGTPSMTAFPRSCFGMAINNPGLSQTCHTEHQVNQDAQTAPHPSESIRGHYDDAFLAKLTHGAGENYKVSITDYTDTGITVQQSATGESDIFGYFSVKFKNKPRMAIAPTVIPNTTGNVSVNVNFQPGVGIWVNASGITTKNVAQETSGSIAITTFDGVDTLTAWSQAENATVTADVHAVGSGADNLFIPVDEHPFYDNNLGYITYFYGARSNLDIFTANGVNFNLDKNPPINDILGDMLLIEANR